MSALRLVLGDQLTRDLSVLDGLDPEVFWQIHRSTIVNANAIAAVTRDFRGQAHVKIKGKDETLVVSRIYSHLFKQM